MPQFKRAISKRYKKKTASFYIFIMPALVGFLIFTLYPMLRSLYLSFTNTSMLIMDEAQFVGLKNYANLFSGLDPYFWLSLKNTFIYAVVNVVGTLLLGLLAAMLLNNKVKARNIYRTIFFLPSLLPAVATALMFRWIFDPAYGITNTILKVIGIKNPPLWMDSANTSMLTLILISLYGFGNKMIIFMSGLNGISRVYYEAAEIDGAGFWTKLFKITLPLLSPIIFYNAIMGTIGALQVFTESFVISGEGGGKGNSTLFYVMNLYNVAYNGNYRLGHASAMAWVLFFIIGGITLVYFAVSKKLVYYENEAR